MNQNDNSVPSSPKSPDAPKPDLRSYKTLDEFLWLRLVRLTNREGQVRYGLTFYRTGNHNKPKTIAYAKNEAYQIWSELKAHIVPLESDHDKEQWIEARVVPPPKRHSRKAKDILFKFGDKLLSRQLEEHCKEYCQRRIERASKTTRVKLCRELAALAAPDEKLNARIVNGYFKQRMTTENHDSPETLRGNRTDIKAIAKCLGIRDVDSLFKGIVIPTTAQLHDAGIAYNEKNRRHLERDEVLAFTCALVALTSNETKPLADAIVLSLLFGPRPQEAPCAQILEHAIYIDGTYKNGRKKSLKTARKGVREISVKRTPVIDAILFLTDCNPKPFPEKSGLRFFRAVAAKASIQDAVTIDRYCLRHTALTWLTRTQAPQREICDMAGHMSLRMLDDHYCFRKVKDQRTWVDAMPLNLDSVPEDWHGFLLECFIVAIWPEIQNGIRPKNDPKFQTLLQILSKAKNVRKKTSLFD